MSPPSDVERYYEANTSSFVSTGQGGAAIRRAIWGPEVKTQKDAFSYVDRCLLELLEARPRPARVVDLGCGTGASLLWLRKQLPLEGTGITISQSQAELANAAFSGVPGLRVVKGDYLALPLELTSLDLAFAIESFAHAPSAEAFMTSIASRLAIGGELVICDDFLGARHRERRGEVSDFQWGWVTPNLVTAEALIELADAMGLMCIDSRDLTPWLELGRPRDRVLEAVVALTRPLRSKNWLLRSWVGGVALQRGLRSGALEHRWMHFVRRR